MYVLLLYTVTMTKQQRLVLVISILASLVAFLDSSVVNVALPAINRELGGGLATQQWVASSYLVTLGALILVAGSLSDLFGRKRVLRWGVLGFGITSLLCALAPTAESLIVARALQGVAGALLVPSSLALIISSFSGKAQGQAIGTWTAWTGISFIIGPLLGGFLVDALSWRWIFVINVAPVLLTVYLLSRLQLGEHQSNARIDIGGAVLCTLGLLGAVFALIEQPTLGWSHPVILGSLCGGIGALVAFILYEQYTKSPMLPLSLFTIRNFTVGNLATTAIYAGLSVATFLITIFVQQVGHYSAVAAGLTILPVTLIMFVLSPKFGALAGNYGPRLFMAVGPIVSALGFLLMLSVDAKVDYWTQLFPGIMLFGTGLSVTVAPLTAAVLGDIDSRHAGIGSAVNNAIARIAGLVAIASIGVVIGESLTLSGFHHGVWLMFGLLTIGGVTSAIGIHNHPNELPADSKS
jgi:EmrB/QacA subfamily drug resistance transporter